MADRLNVNTITDDDLSALYDERDRLAEFVEALRRLLIGTEVARE